MPSGAAAAAVITRYSEKIPPFTEMISRGLFFQTPFLFAALAFLLAVPLLFSEETDTPPGNQFFLTTQEKLYEGVPEDRGDSWLIKPPGQSGGFLISKLDVLFIGDTRESVFEFRKSRLPAGNYVAVSNLAEWGTRNQLAGQALRLLEETAAEADPETRIVLRRQIERIEYVERLKKEAIDRASTSENQETARPAKDPEQARLEEFGRQVPLSLQDAYARKIQPLLLRRCAVADCHEAGVQGNSFTLAKPQRRTARQDNLANLEQILRRVDLAMPASSRILNHPEIIDPYGQQVYPFGSDANSLKDYKLFSEWVLSLGKKIKPIRFTEPMAVSAGGAGSGTGEKTSGTGSEGTDAEPGFTGTQPSPFHTRYSQASASTIGAPRPLDLTEPSSETPKPAEPKYRRLPAPAEFPSLSVIEEPKIRDEFDPEPFNSKYHPEGKPPSGGSEPLE